MGKLFPGVPRIKKSPETIAAENPSLWLGFLPVIGGAITTPMQIGEINRATEWQSAAHHFVKLTALNSLRSRSLGYATRMVEGGKVAAQLATRFEPKVVIEAHLARLTEQARLRRVLGATNRPHFELPPIRRVLQTTFRTGQIQPKRPTAQLPRFVERTPAVISRKPLRNQHLAP